MTDANTPRPRGRPLGEPDTSTPRGQVGAAIRSARLAAEITVPDAAEAVGVVPATWYDWERGKSFPPLDRISPICDVLGCEIGDLIPEGD